MTEQQRWTGWFYITKEEWDKLSEKYRIAMCYEELDLMIKIRSHPHSGKDTVLDLLDEIPTYPSDLGDMILVSDLEEELRQAGEP
jgi:hypothetical protein